MPLRNLEKESELVEAQVLTLSGSELPPPAAPCQQSRCTALGRRRGARRASTEAWVSHYKRSWQEAIAFCLSFPRLLDSSVSKAVLRFTTNEVFLQFPLWDAG